MHLARTVLALGASAAFIAGCSPTYGTGTPASVQLLDDLGSAASIRGAQNTDIEYQPRPGLVTTTNGGQLPPPQTSVTETERWPESPEQTRQRMRAEATVTGDSALSTGDGRDSVGPYEDPNGPFAYRNRTGRAGSAPPPPGWMVGSDAQQRFREARQQTAVSPATERRFLSEPPTEYRQPAASAPVGEFGESEQTKQRRRERAAEIEGTGGRKWWPF